jgi:uncharacterized BrkB/YihY/UPF0761 family membrane protein
LVGVLAVSLLLPEHYHFLLPMLQIPLLVVTRVPQVCRITQKLHIHHVVNASVASLTQQILTNFKNKSTGQLSIVTVGLTFVGALVRVFTTIQEVGWDMSLLSSTLLGASTGLLLLLQIVFYKKVDKDKKKKKQ